MFNWLKSKTNGPDFSHVDSRNKVETAAREGTLVPMLLLPGALGGTPDEPNLVFVPAWAAEQKEHIDVGTVLPLAQEGKITKYSAEPAYKGKSFVPSAVTIRAHTPADFTATINIW